MKVPSLSRQIKALEKGIRASRPGKELHEDLEYGAVAYLLSTAAEELDKRPVLRKEPS